MHESLDGFIGDPDYDSPKGQPVEKCRQDFRSVKTVGLGPGGRLVTIADEPPEGVDATFFVVEPDGEQLAEVGDLVDEGALHPAIDSIFPLEEFRAAFDRSMASGKQGKVVLRVIR